MASPEPINVAQVAEFSGRSQPHMNHMDWEWETDDFPNSTRQSKHVNHNLLLSLWTSFLSFQSVWQEKYCQPQLKKHFLIIQELLAPIPNPWENLTSAAYPINHDGRVGVVLGIIWLLQIHFCEHRSKIQELIEKDRHLKRYLLQQKMEIFLQESGVYK